MTGPASAIWSSASGLTSSWLLVLMAAVFGGLAIWSAIVVLASLRTHARRRAARRWRQIRGVMLEHHVAFARDCWYDRQRDGYRVSRNPDLYRIRVKYAYELDGRRHVSERLNLSGSGVIAHSPELERWLCSLDETTGVDVFYDPERPARSVLFR